MGITSLSVARLQKFNCFSQVKMCELGAQNLYVEGTLYGSIAKDYFQSFGVEHDSYDIYVHQGCEYLDLREPISKNLKGMYDVITDFGTTEHVDTNYYMAYKNIHNLLKENGIIIKENPKTGHWPNHGYNYVDVKFYQDLAEANNYEILDLCEEFAMGNYVDGCNVCVVMRKKGNRPFMTEKAFSKLNVYSK